MEAKQGISNNINNIYEILVIDKSNSSEEKNLISDINENLNKDLYENNSLFYKEKIVNFQNINYHLKIYLISDKKSLKYSILQNIKKFNTNIFIYDIAEIKSFDNIELYINELEKENNEGGKILIGNNRDINKKREVPKEEAENLAKKYKMKYFEIYTGKSKLFTELFNYNFINNILKDNNVRKTSLEENKNNLNDTTRIEVIEDKYYKEYRNIIEYMVRSSDEKLYMSIKEKQDKMNNQLSFFFSNDFAQKIFDLFDKFQTI